MRFEVLGPLQVDTEDAPQPRPVAAARLRTALAVLLWHAGHPVPIDELCELVWDGAPPDGAPVALRALVLRLRRALGPLAGARITTHSPGYGIELSADELDATRFETLCRDTGQAVRAGRWAEASGRATEALALWRGAPLADVSSQLLRDRWIPRLEQTRVQALEWRIEAELHLGRHDQVVPQLRELTGEHPLRERFHAQLMLALTRAGRQAEALTAFSDARRVLVDQLGIEPGPELQSLHQRILAGDTELVTPVRAARVPASPVPRQLPAAVRHFVGRTAELKALSGLLSQVADGGAAVISAIGGTAGIGKTALALHWAHQHADRFPDGQLYVNLRGFDPSDAPTEPATAVRGFLIALGVPAHRIPASPDEQAALYRSQLADRRVLVLLDNARDAEQVRPLLPGSPGCLVLITSRDRLAGLVALDGAVPVPLDLLTEHEAGELLIRRLGRERANVDDAVVIDLIRLCARLPLALSIAAAHAALHPERPLARLAEELTDAHRRLDTLTAGETTADIRAVFSWSYRTLTPEQARVFRLLGLHFGPDISLPAAAGLTGLDPDRTRRALDTLTRNHLLTEQTPGRYAFHDLLRAYATEQAQRHDSETERQDALRRALDFALHTAHAADRLLSPQRQPIRLDPPAPGVISEPLPDIAAALAWFQAEHPVLLAAQHTAAGQAWHLAVWQLAWALETFHYRRGHPHDRLAMWQAALAAAGHLPDPAQRVHAHRLLGGTFADLGRYDEGIGHLHRALTLAEDQHDLDQQALTHRLLAWSWERRGDDRQAMTHAGHALELVRALDQPVGEADALNAVGWCAARLGEFAAARAHCEAALALLRDHDSPDSEADTLDSLGYIAFRSGDHQQAVDHYRRAVTMFRALGNAASTANTLDNLGHPLAALGQHEQARAVWRQAVELYREQGRDQSAERVQRQLDTLEISGSAQRI